MELQINDVFSKAGGCENCVLLHLFNHLMVPVLFGDSGRCLTTVLL